jgi:late competence protein required for DNA uptake (superfamily II DNA/RNA helicase)
MTEISSSDLAKEIQTQKHKILSIISFQGVRRKEILKTRRGDVMDIIFCTAFLENGLP